MNEREVLVYHYSKKNNWYDATNFIESISYGGNSWIIKFKRFNRTSYVSFSNVRIYENPERVNFKAVYYKGTKCFNVSEVLCFNGEIYKIFKNNGKSFIASSSELRISRDLLESDSVAFSVIEYYKRVAVETACNEVEEFVAGQLSKINQIDEDSVLALYLQKKAERRAFKSKHPIISPFGINLSQSEAIKTMLKNRICIIEGPPGTGKTQTILNFIANAVINNYSVAIASNNNSATGNVYEKLDKYNYSFMTAQLGSVDNICSFFESYDPKVPYFKESKVDINELRMSGERLPEYFKLENDRKKLIRDLEEIKTEYKHFIADNIKVNFTEIKYKPNKVRSKIILKTILKYKETDLKLGFIKRFYLRQKLKLKKSFFTKSKNECLLYLKNYYYLSKISELNREISTLSSRIGDRTFEELKSKYVQTSKSYFENELSAMFKNNNRDNYDNSNYKRLFNEFIKDYPVILSSTYSLAKCSQKGFLFDYLIIDEASQVNMPTSFLSMSVARNLVIVGDIKQLPQIENNKFKKRSEELLEYFNIPREFSYYGNSILSSLLLVYGDKVPKVTLREHYRCNPDIISFCNKRFYDNELILYKEPTEHDESDYSIKMIKTVPGNFARKSPNGSGLYNQREIDEIINLLKTEDLKDVGIISPYVYHTSILNNLLGESVEASTIHKFQGREKQTIIFSSVINDYNDFVENENLINVAVSRAINKFIFVTSDKIANSKKGILSDLVNYIQYNTAFAKSEEGTIVSIYDLLYSDYQHELELFRKKHPSKDFDSENITRVLIKKILKTDDYKSYDFKMHVSLCDFIYADNMNLLPEENVFLNNPNSHADFLIYNKMSKKPVLVIEVDGVSFHEQNKVQSERDRKKESILSKAGLPLLRLKTNESGEEERIKNALNASLL